jgi:hypothetical protein
MYQKDFKLHIGIKSHIIFTQKWLNCNTKYNKIS